MPQHRWSQHHVSRLALMLALMCLAVAIHSLSHIHALRKLNPRFAQAIHGLSAQSAIHGLRKTIHGWSRSTVCAEHIYVCMRTSFRKWDRLSSPCLKRLRHKSIMRWARSQFTRTWLGTDKSKLRSIADSPEQDICQRLQSDRWREGEPGDISILLINLDTCRQYHYSISQTLLRYLMNIHFLECYL